MIPEGLQHSSIQDIVAWFPKLGLNSVRLTFAIEMIDDYMANSPNQTLEKSVINALGQSNGTKVLSQILSKNPQFSKNTTRLQVWDAVGKELSKQGVIIHLDNHVSKAFWCCADNDGNGWFGEKFFDVEKWKRGLAFMAKHVSSFCTHFNGHGADVFLGKRKLVDLRIDRLEKRAERREEFGAGRLVHLVYPYDGCRRCRP
jgi:endoglucanase